MNNFNKIKDFLFIRQIKFIFSMFFIFTSLGFFVLSIPYSYALDFAGFNLKDIVDIIVQFLGSAIIPFLIVVAFFAFVINIFLFIRHTGTGEGKEKAKWRLLYPIIVLFVLFSLWGFIALVRVLFST